MSILDQCVFILNISLLILRQLLIIRDNKIKINKINKLNIYYKDCINLKN